MSTVNPILRTAYKSKDGTYPIVIRVIDGRNQKLFPVGYKIPEKFWAQEKVSSKHPQATLINSVIASKEAEIRRYLADCQLHGKPIHLDLIGTGRASYSFTDYLRHRARQYEQAGKIIMKRKLYRYVDELLSLDGREIYFEEVNLDLLRRLEQKQVDNGNVENTRHKKFKLMSEFYSHAMAEGKAPAPNPFKAYKIAAKPVKKDKLSGEQIAAIEGLKLKPGPIADARDLFLFSFYTKGQRFEVCVTLRRDQVRAGRIFFRTNKGNDHISVKIHARLQAIIDRFIDGGELLFPFLKSIPQDPEEYINAIGSLNTTFNKNLKIVASLAGIPIPVSFHLARHAFAWQLKQVSDNVNVIQDALGHSDQRTTQIYLKALEDERLDGEMEKLYGL